MGVFVRHVPRGVSALLPATPVRAVVRLRSAAAVAVTALLVAGLLAACAPSDPPRYSPEWYRREHQRMVRKVLEDPVDRERIRQARLAREREERALFAELQRRQQRERQRQLNEIRRRREEFLRRQKEFQEWQARARARWEREQAKYRAEWMLRVQNQLREGQAPSGNGEEAP